MTLSSAFQQKLRTRIPKGPLFRNRFLIAKPRDPYYEIGFTSKIYGTCFPKYLNLWDPYFEIDLKPGPGSKKRDPYSEIKNARDPYSETKPNLGQPALQILTKTLFWSKKFEDLPWPP